MNVRQAFFILAAFLASGTMASPLKPRQAQPADIETNRRQDGDAAAWLEAHPEIPKPSSFDWETYAKTQVVPGLNGATPPTDPLAGQPTASFSPPDVGAGATVDTPAAEPPVTESPAEQATPTQAADESVPTHSIPTDASASSQAVSSPPAQLATVSSQASVDSALTPATTVTAAAETPATAIAAVSSSTVTPPNNVTGGTAGDFSYGSVVVPADNDTCCGYKLVDHGDRYYPKSLVIDFANIADGTDMSSLGFKVLDGEHSGPVSRANPAARGEGKKENVYVKGGILHIVVPGGQGDTLHPQGGEIQLAEPITAGVFTMDAQVSKVNGTCQAIFTYVRGDDSVMHDELDMEITPARWWEGMGLSAYGPGGDKQGVFETNMDGLDTSFNRYTIGWYNDAPPAFYLNGKATPSPGNHLPVNPSTLMINNWSNGDPGFTAGPPAEDSVLQIRKLEFYYQSQEEHSVQPALKAGCSLESACVVGGNKQ
ncbi:hypothetical protein IAU60_005290 [Kwoniella sp. DSM 27419]